MKAATRFAAAILVGVSFAALAQTYPNMGRDLAAACAICHGTSGVNTGGMPDLAAQPKDYLVRQLQDFRDGKRPATVMQQISKGLTDEQIDAVAAYFSAQTLRETR